MDPHEPRLATSEAHSVTEVPRAAIIKRNAISLGGLSAAAGLASASGSSGSSLSSRDRSFTPLRQFGRPAHEFQARSRVHWIVRRQRSPAAREPRLSRRALIVPLGVSVGIGVGLLVAPGAHSSRGSPPGRSGTPPSDAQSYREAALPAPAKGFGIPRDRLTANASPEYGPLAFGTSARSPYETDWPAGGFIGIHGTDQPALIPGRVWHGCIRLRNAAILKLGKLMPVGTPVTIR